MRGCTIALAGDVMLGRLVDEAIHERGIADPWTHTRVMLEPADAFVYNLECAVCGDLPRWREGEKTFHFRLRRELTATLLESDVDAVLVANNHIMDHDVAGLIETLDALDALGVPHAGAGRDLADARAPARFRAATGARVALVGAADHLREWAARERAPGIFLIDPARSESAEGLASAIAQARQGADVVVLGLHWGPNMRRVPPPEFRRFARRAVDAGADIVWGTSAHLFQGIEFYHERVILYDAGDFLDDYAVDPIERNDLSFLFLADLDEEARCRDVRLVPVAIHDRRTRPALDEEGHFLLARMRKLCVEFGTHIDARERSWTAMPAKMADERLA